MSGGWNPVTGRDSTGSRPVAAPYGTPLPGVGQAYIPHFGGPANSFGLSPAFPPWQNITYGSTFIGAAPPNPYAHPSFQAPMVQTGAYTVPPGYAYQPNGAGNMLPRQTQPYPSIDPATPAAQMTNSTGGTGCEPGYNYFFPPEHTKIHVFRSTTAPWQLPAHSQITFAAYQVSSDMTLEKLLKGSGCNNPSPKKNFCYEIHNAGNGKWSKGMVVNGADKDKMKKTLREVGWDSTRTGRPGEPPVVCLWFVKG
ncbi:hypothetical protein S40285_06009 [Stachybotrys chlorohalonatus IBT 40285]|uniref:Uncharacterized protein n=1 Tax=Stachybotrys chlorohalonatus (strain IBT 40285) TaxID=1283841 RepID=A0A084R0N1_STAC4|nr:hypothetical protein S40285_06009 [Stachybotrys chlorohalonata IBT 40285]